MVMRDNLKELDRSSLIMVSYHFYQPRDEFLPTAPPLLPTIPLPCWRISPRYLSITVPTYFIAYIYYQYHFSHWLKSDLSYLLCILYLRLTYQPFLLSIQAQHNKEQQPSQSNPKFSSPTFNNDSRLTSHSNQPFLQPPVNVSQAFWLLHFSAKPPRVSARTDSWHSHPTWRLRMRTPQAPRRPSHGQLRP